MQRIKVSASTNGRGVKRPGLLLVISLLVVNLLLVGFNFFSVSSQPTVLAANNAPKVSSFNAPIKTVFMVLMENHNWADIKGSASAPYINNTLLSQASYTNDYNNPPGIHPSEPNYLWLEAGTNFGIANDSDPSANHQSTTAHLVTQLQNAGVSWKSYQEDISGTTCPLTSVNLYAPKHNPMVFFDDVTNTNDSQSSNCISHVRPYTELANDMSSNNVAKYNFITPNLCNDMHNTCAPTSDSIKQGDTWLSNQIPAILNSAAYKDHGALFITWDEGEGGSDGPVGMIVLSPDAKGNGYTNSIHYTHSSTLRTVQEIFGVGPFLGDAANATDLSDLFNTPVVPTTTTPATTTTPVPTTPVPTTTTYTYYLPFLANIYKPSGVVTGSFTTYVAFQNVGSGAANVSLAYVDNQGNAVATPGGTCSTVALYGECIAGNPFPIGSRGAGVLTSSQPLNVIVAESTPAGGSAYAVPEGANSTLNAPFAFNKTFGNYSTQLTVFNGGTTTSNVTVKFYDVNGNSPVNTTQTFQVGPKQSYSLDQSATTGNIPVGFNGWAQIVGDNGSSLVAQVLEQNPSNGYVAIANAEATPLHPGGVNTVYAPAVFNQAYGAFVTGADIINPSSSTVTVSVTYYNLAGTATTTSPFTIAPYGLTSVYQGATVVSGTTQTGLPVNGLPVGFAGAAAVTSTGNGVIMAVNEFGGLTSGGTPQSGTYLAASSGGSTVGLPVIAHNGFGYTTGDTILNTSSQTVTATIQYYNVDGTTVGTATQFTIGPNASQAFFQGAAGLGLPDPFYGTAVVRVTSGPANPLIVTTNAVSTNFFYTFTEPNS